MSCAIDSVLKGPLMKKLRSQDPARASAELRSMILHLDPASLGIKPSNITPNVWGALMELWMNRAVVTIVSLADGTASMYFSSGGGILGSGESPAVADAGREFIRTAETVQSTIPKSIACPFPKPGCIRFHLLTFDGYRSTEVSIEDVERNQPLSSLYATGQELITQIRIHTEQRARR